MFDSRAETVSRWKTRYAVRRRVSSWIHLRQYRSRSLGEYGSWGICISGSKCSSSAVKKPIWRVIWRHDMSELSGKAARDYIDNRSEKHVGELALILILTQEVRRIVEHQSLQ